MLLVICNDLHLLFQLYVWILVRKPAEGKVIFKKEDWLVERMSSSRNILAKDRFDQPVFLFENDFALRWFADKYPDVELEEKM